MQRDIPRSNTAANNFQVEPDGPKGPESPSVLGFQDFNLCDEILNGLSAQTMYRPHEIQGKVLPCLLNEPSKNLICISPPGSGKTIALCISILQKLDLSSEEAQNTPQALILVPSWDLAEYMRDLFETIGQFLRGPRGRLNLKARNFCSPVIVGTPGSVIDEFRRRSICYRQIKILAMDAADDILEIQGGGDTCVRLKWCLGSVDQLQIALFSATSFDEIKRFSEKFAPEANIIMQEPDKKPKLVHDFYVRVSAESKLDTFMNMMNVGALRGSLIIFVSNSASSAKILKRLREEQFSVGSMAAENREDNFKAWKEFMAQETKILIVTRSYYRSLGVRSVGNVVIYDILTAGTRPYSLSDEERFLKLVRCSGRASQGRCGNTLIFVDKEEDLTILNYMESYLQTKIPCLEWDNLDQLELIWERLIVISANRPELLEDGTIMIHKRQKQKLIADNILRGRDIEELENCQTGRDQPPMPTIKCPNQDPRYPPKSDKSGQKFYNDGNAVSYVAEDPQGTLDTVAYSPNPQQTRQPKSRRKPAQKQRKRSPNDNVGMDTRDPVKTHRGVTLEEPDTMNPISHKTINYLHETVDRRLQYKSKDERVRIAVLDTGIDLNHADFKLARTKWFNGKLESNPEKGETPQRDRIVNYKNFCDQEGSDGKDNCKEDGNIDDRDGHGTKVAGIILRLAPNADLYIARICPGMNRADPPGADGVRLQGPQVPAVEKAIEWAIDERVHIINMSLGFKNPTHKDIQSLKTVLNKAKANHIVVFAAASNDGEHEKTAWPARDDEYAIGIHSATDLGKKSEIIARPIHMNHNFMVVGKGILSQRPSWDGGGFVPCTGASFATPVATAMGALVLSFAWQKVCRRNRAKAEKKVLLDDLTTNRGMSKVLKEISEEVDGYRHISSCLLWKDFFESGDSDDSDKSLDESMDHAWGVIVRALLP